MLLSVIGCQLSVHLRPGDQAQRTDNRPNRQHVVVVSCLCICVQAIRHRELTTGLTRRSRNQNRQTTSRVNSSYPATNTRDDRSRSNASSQFFTRPWREQLLTRIQREYSM